MKLLTTNSGSYPRVGDEPGQMRLRETYQKWEEEKVSDEKLEETYQDYTKEIIQEQENAGLDLITDGQLRWHDPFSHFAKDIEGCEINGLLRYFDTNFYFRQPIVTDTLKSGDSIVEEEFLSAKEVANVPVKPVLTGPYTLAKYSINQHYDDFRELTLDFVDVIANEVEQLAEAGAEEIQIDEPGILKNEEDYELFSEAIERVSEAGNGSRISLYTYFGDCVPFYEDFQDLPVDVLGLDFTYSPELPELIEEIGSDKALGLGLINARNTKMEKKKK